MVIRDELFSNANWEQRWTYSFHAHFTYKLWLFYFSKYHHKYSQAAIQINQKSLLVPKPFAFLTNVLATFKLIFISCYICFFSWFIKIWNTKIFLLRSRSLVVNLLLHHANPFSPKALASILLAQQQQHSLYVFKAWWTFCYEKVKI